MFKMFPTRKPSTPTEANQPGVTAVVEQPDLSPAMATMTYTPEQEPAARPKPPLGSSVLVDAANAIAADDAAKREAMLAFAVQVARHEVDASAVAEFCRQHGATPAELDQLVGAFRRRENLIHEAGQVEQYQRDGTALIRTVEALKQEADELRATVKRKEHEINVRLNDARVAGVAARACRAARVRLEREAELQQFDAVDPMPAEVAKQPAW